MHFIKWWKENASWVTVWCWCSTSKDCYRSVKHLAVWTLCLKYLRPILMLLSRKDSTCNLKTCSYHITDSSTPDLKDSGSMRRTVSTFTVFLDLYSMQLHLSVCDPIPHLSSIWAPSVICLWSDVFAAFISGCKLGKLGDYSYVNGLQNSHGVFCQGELSLT